MHIHQQNHWNDIIFYWYQSYHWYQWTIGIALYPARSHGKIISPLNEMHIHQQNHWNDIPFYWYQWTIGLTNRICLCILDMCGGSKTRWRNITKLWVSKRGILWIHRLHHVIVPRWGKDAVAVSVQVNDNQFTLQVLFSENTVHFRCSRTGEFSIFSSTRLRNTFN